MQPGVQHVAVKLHQNKEPNSTAWCLLNEISATFTALNINSSGRVIVV